MIEQALIRLPRVCFYKRGTGIPPAPLAPFRPVCGSDAPPAPPLVASQLGLVVRFPLFKKADSVEDRVCFFKRGTGIEPASRAWEARILPMY